MIHHTLQYNKGTKLTVYVTYIRNRQARNVSSSQNLSTVAIFLSGVTATSLQYALPLPSTSLSTSVILLWSISLVFSISSAITSQYALYWETAFHKSPPRHVPALIRITITHLPFILLGTASALLLLGFPVFAFAFFRPSQIFPLSVITLSVSALLIALLLAGAWQVGETWAGTRLRGLSERLYAQLSVPFSERRFPEEDEWFMAALGNRMMHAWRSLQVHHISNYPRFLVCATVFSYSTYGRRHSRQYHSLSRVLGSSAILLARSPRLQHYAPTILNWVGILAMNRTLRRVSKACLPRHNTLP